MSFSNLWLIFLARSALVLMAEPTLSLQAAERARILATGTRAWKTRTNRRTISSRMGAVKCVMRHMAAAAANTALYSRTMYRLFSQVTSAKEPRRSKLVMPAERERAGYEIGLRHLQRQSGQFTKNLGKQGQRRAEH